MSSLIPLIFICIIYDRIIRYEGLELMKNQKPWKLKTFVRLYNGYQVVACSYFIWKFFQLGFSFKKIVENENFEEKYHEEFVVTFWWLLMLRLSEFIETFTFVLRKKNNQISILHIYHHVAIVLLGYLSFKWALSMVLICIVIINSAVHVIMYSYYFFSTFETLKPCTNRIKHYLTAIQIVQLLSFLMISISCSSNLCGTNIFLYTLLNIALLILISLFVSFYFSNFISLATDKKNLEKIK